MPRFDENCKAAVVDIARATQGTPTAKLLAVLIAAGITDNRELAEITGLSIRSIQHARATHCASDATHCAQPIAPRNPLRPEAQPIAPDAQSIALARDLQRAQANTESPTEISSPSEERLVYAPLPLKAEPKVKTPRGARLPTDWALPLEWRQWAEINTQLGADGITLEADKFRDHWHAKAGPGSTKLDWQATWRNWCRNAGSRRPMNWGRNAHDERKAADKPMTLREALNRRIEQERAAA